MTRIRTTICWLTAIAASATATRPSLAQTNVIWLPTSVADYNEPSNWDNGTTFPAVPDAAFNEIATINNGGIAFLSATSLTPTGGVVLGQDAADTGTLEIRNGGNLTAQVGTAPAGTPPDGSVVVGSVGAGTLRVLSGGTLSATARSLGRKRGQLDRARRLHGNARKCEHQRND